ncbi:MAG TPA: HEXXH motif-containing putative peptide modification protein [Actinoplanes sp.]
MRTFRLSDAEFAALAAGRPTAATLGELRKAQLSRHLLLLREIGTVPAWYAGPDARHRLADPMTALHTAATLVARRAGSAPPPEHNSSARILTATHLGRTLRVRLEDTDPLRARLGLDPADPLDDAAAAAWQHHLEGAWRLLVERHRAAAETVAAVLSVIVPVHPDPGAGGISATSADAYGAVALSAPADATSLAVGLLHETQHSILNAVRVLFDLVRPSTELGYSPWRADPRPPFGILHGAYAYLAVTRFWRGEAARSASGETARSGDELASDDLGMGGHSQLAAFEFARWRAAVVEAADGLLASAVLTAAGRRFAGALRDEVLGWLDEPVPPVIGRLAAGANTEHRVRWRLENLTVEPATVATLVAAWRSGAAPPAVPAAAVRPATGRALERSDRLRLVHDLLRSERDQSLPPGSGVRPGTDAQLGENHRTGASAYLKNADARYLQGDHDGALAGYLAGLEEFPAEIALWAGVALTSPYRMVRERPELVRAVWRTLGVELRTVANWWQ